MVLPPVLHTLSSSFFCAVVGAGTQQESETVQCFGRGSRNLTEKQMGESKGDLSFPSLFDKCKMVLAIKHDENQCFFPLGQPSPPLFLRVYSWFKHCLKSKSLSFMNLHKVQSTGGSGFVGNVTLESKEIKHSVNTRYC